MTSQKPGRLSVAVTAKSRAPATAVFALLKDGATWPSWSSFDAFELQRPGPGDPLGVGAIRVFITRVSRAREEVVEVIDGGRLSYVLLSGLPMVNYRAVVDLDAVAGGGTVIRWRPRFDAKVFVTGWLWRLFMTQVLSTISRQLAGAAERASVTPPRQIRPNGTVH